MISVICPTYNEEKYISVCLDSILQCDYPHQDLEVLIVDGCSTDQTRSIVQSYVNKFPFIKLIDNFEKIVPAALNIGIAQAKGNIIIRIDAHAIYESNYFSTLVHYLQQLNADNVGTVCKTEVLNKTPKSLAIREILSNKLGVGNSTFRTEKGSLKEVDTVPFGCWKKEVFEKYGNFNIKLIRNQDIEFNKRIINGGGKIYLVPESFCTYFARETFSDLAVNNFANGKWNILTVWYTNYFKSLSVRHFIPMLYMFSLLIPLLGCIFYFPLIYIFLSIFVVYIGAIFLLCLSFSLKKQLNIFYLLMGFIILHFSYGLGSFIGLITMIFHKK